MELLEYISEYSDWRLSVIVLEGIKYTGTRDSQYLYSDSKV